MKGVQILNLMGNSRQRVLVHRDMENFSTSDSVDILLTPQFYTFLQEELGVKFSYQAKQVAPSLFDDYLNENLNYQFYVHKHGEFWHFFAYSVEEIINFLKERGIEESQINKIYFIQELESELQAPTQLSQKRVMQSINDTVTLIPKKLLGLEESEYREFNIDEVSLKNGVAMSSSYESLIPLKQTIILSLLLVFLGVIFLVEGGRIRGSVEESIARYDNLIDKNPKLSSAMIRKSILSKYEPIDKLERTKRDYLEKISKMLSVNSSLKSLSLDDKKITATIKTKNSSVSKQVKKHASSGGFKIIKSNNQDITIQRSL